MKKLLLILVVAVAPVLGGCYGPIIEGAQQGYDGTRRDSLTAGAKAGDAADQFALGNTYCCQGAGPLHDMSVYDNVKATQWYCRAARQGYGPAQERLARLYSGHPIRGLHILLRISDMMGTDDTNLSVALMWATRAAETGEQSAIELRDDIASHASAAARARAETMSRQWKTAPCRWDEVIPVAGKKAER